MEVGDLVKMDFETGRLSDYNDIWGTGIIVTVEDRTPDDVEVLWASGVLSWEMKIMLEKIDESR